MEARLGISVSNGDDGSATNALVVLGGLEGKSELPWYQYFEPGA